MKINDPSAEQIASPTLRRLYDYWRTRRSDGALPGRAALRPEEMVPLLPQVFLVDVRDGGASFHYRLIGTRVAQWSGGDATGWEMDDPRCGAGGAVLLALHRETVSTRRPVLVAGEPSLFNGSMLSFDRLLLPLAGDGRTIDMILGGADGRPATA